MNMERRHAHLLQGVVEEYIATGVPVGSARLGQLLGLRVSPATIRGALRELEEEGFLEQPHTSAGRVPTDNGYRYYVNSVRLPELSEQARERLERLVGAYSALYPSPALAAAKLLAVLSSATAVGGWIGDQDIHGAGLSHAFEETGQEETAREILSMLDEIESTAEQFAQAAHESMQVYIGHENPVIEGEHTSVLVRVVGTEHSGEAVLLLIGPKRMPYRRNMQVLNGVASLFEQMMI